MLLQYYKCEQKKFLYQKWNVIVMLGLLVFVPVMAITLDSYTGGTGVTLTKSKLIEGFYLGQAGYAVLTALYFGYEYQKSALRTSLLGTPKRGMFLTAKLLCILTWTVILLLANTIFSLAAIAMSSSENLGIGEALSLLLPDYLSTLEIVIITSALVILTRSMIVSMAIMVSLVLGLGNLLLQYSSEMKYLPVLSTMNSFFVVRVPQYLAINEGTAVQALWGAALLMIAFLVFNRRYVR